MQTKTSTFAKSADPDEMARNEPSHQDLHCLPFCFNFTLEPLFASGDKSKFKDGRVHFRNSDVKGLRLSLQLLERLDSKESNFTNNMCKCA